MGKLGSMSGFEGYAENTALTGECPTLLKSYPPGLVLGEAVHEKTQKLLEAQDSNRLATVTLNQLTCKYAYSTPATYHNLVTPESKIKMPGNF